MTRQITTTSPGTVAGPSLRQAAAAWADANTAVGHGLDIARFDSGDTRAAERIAELDNLSATGGDLRDLAAAWTAADLAVADALVPEVEEEVYVRDMSRIVGVLQTVTFLLAFTVLVTADLGAFYDAYLAWALEPVAAFLAPVLTPFVAIYRMVADAIAGVTELYNTVTGFPAQLNSFLQ